MLKKLLLVTAIGLGLLYGTGNDLGTVKHHLTGTVKDNARNTTAGDSQGWGTDSGY